jgi:catechol 2,3-dioxygenase-like lactoylglutathione lyase family enzyme
MARSTQPYRGGHLAVVVDCADLDRAAAFWTAALGYVRAASTPCHEGIYLPLEPAGGAGIELLLQRVPESKHGKARLHLDLRTRDLPGELDRLLGLGARVSTSGPVTEAGWCWHVLADPDGNEFCLLRPPESYWN